MKIITILLVFMLNLSCIAQDNKIQSSLLTINGIEYLGKDESFLIQNMGIPIKEEPYDYEMDDTKGKTIEYQGIVFYVNDFKVDSFEITNDIYSFTNFNINVGDNIEVLKSNFPSSYLNKQFDKGISVNLVDIDKFVNFEYNDKLTIFKIGVYSY